MKITKKHCREVGIFNDYDYCKGNPFLYYLPASSGWATFKSWRIYWPKHNLGEHWLDNGCKVFSFYNREEKQETFEKSKQWMMEKFNIKEIDRSPTGSWMDKDFIEKRNAEIEKMIKG